jgi:hypothetical protein
MRELDVGEKYFSEAKTQAPNTGVKGKAPQWAQKCKLKREFLRPLR